MTGLSFVCFRLVDWLDEYHSGSFRQAQVSFASRIPGSFPVGDAMTMSPNLLLYCNFGKLDLKSALIERDNTNSDSGGGEEFEKSHNSNLKYSANAMGKDSPGQSDNTLIPNVLMLSKHRNGSLNLWQISFADCSKFSTVLSIAHASRACGHRFHTNSATCHPVLPLLLTTSHHNLPNENASIVEAANAQLASTNPFAPPLNNRAATSEVKTAENNGFVSELILWRVDPVGPLSKSGGVTELARVDSPGLSAFSDVAWVPTLLPR